MLNATAKIAKMMALTAAAGEGVVTSMGQLQDTLVLKDTGSEIFKMEIRHEGVTFIPSEDFKNDEHSYDLLV